jgi:hypothetical protein
LRGAYTQALTAARRRREERAGPPACHAGDHEPRAGHRVRRPDEAHGACVARDSELDSQWNQLDSAVLAYGRCIDCTHRATIA